MNVHINIHIIAHHTLAALISAGLVTLALVLAPENKNEKPPLLLSEATHILSAVSDR